MIGVLGHARYRINMPIHSSNKWLSKYLLNKGRKFLTYNKEAKLQNMNSREGKSDVPSLTLQH